MEGTESIYREKFKSISLSVDTESCSSDCDRTDACSTFRKFMGGLGPRDPLEGPENTVKEHRDMKEDLCKFLNENHISLVDHLCTGGGDKSVLQTLLTIDDGCDIISNQLDSLKEFKNLRNTIIEVKLGCGKLFDKEKPGEQAKILKELIGVRNRTPAWGRSYNTLTGLIKHPVMVIFIREKWEKVKFGFFVHLR